MSELITNRSHRIEQLKSIIKRLHAGEAPQSVRDELETLVKSTSPGEIAEMEQSLMADGMTAEEITSMCDLHSQVLRSISDGGDKSSVEPGHPVDTFQLENWAIRNAIENIGKISEQLTETPAKAEQLKQKLLEELNALMDIDKHYARKENLLFPKLEKYDITGPTQVMWAKDDEIRSLLKECIAALRDAEEDSGELKKVMDGPGRRAMAAVEEMIYKEEEILLPISLDALSDEDWGEIFHSSPEIGWCLVEPRTGYSPPRAAEAPSPARLKNDESIIFETGHLNEEQLKGILSVIPFDLTFIDADDRVAYFSTGKDRIFQRNKTIIGRKVQHCHPPKSVDIVEQILDDFKSGRQDSAEFWIQMNGVFVHITYYAVRNSNGEYTGTLEITQNATHVRSLEGERRLLEYD